MARASFGFAAPLSSSIRHLTHHPFTLTSSKSSRFPSLRSTASDTMLDSSGNFHPSLEVGGGAVEKFLPAFKSLHLTYAPTPFISWNRHAKTIFAAFFRSLPDVKFRRECIRARNGGNVALDWVSGDDRNLDLFQVSPVAVYVRHMLLRARAKGWRVLVFNSRGCDHTSGAVCGRASLVNSMMDLHQGALLLLGPTMNPKVASELSERLPHLGLRMKEHCRRALEYATRMKKLGLKVIYPGLEDHPDHALLKSMVNKEYGYGGIVCMDMVTEEKANLLMNLLQNYSHFGLMAVSLGYYETLISCSRSSTSSELSEEEKSLAGISPGLVRMSIGYNGTKWSQFEKSLTRMI